ncbi:hypothetical protein ACH5RR_001312 [Cinchona calisaya]|uniref:DUF3444 domain-containing protein n=1 Tax=Cinchona calisaya TaxID=153742 RepID=A0ABD3B3B2_9GENT
MEYEGTAPTVESLPRCNENVDFVDVSVSDSAGSDDTDKGIINCPVPEFNDFDKHREQNCFSVDEIWACYDNTPDAMPRFYAQVRKVYFHGFKLRLCWLDPHPDYEGGIDWARKGLPVACGQFACGMTGNEEEGVPEGSFELDPASMPVNL